MKIRNGLNKYIQRTALKGILPEPVRTGWKRWDSTRIGKMVPNELAGRVEALINDSKFSQML